jgi:peroxiredoxin Q/BCP
MGREYMGILRTSFLVNPEGKIAKVYENVNPVFHAEEVLRDIVQLKLANK